MKVVILAAGFSTRLYPLTKSFPKGLLPVQGQELIRSVLDSALAQTQISEFALITNQLCFPHHQKFLDQDQYQHITLIDNGVSEETERLGAIGDLQFAIDRLGWGRDDLLVLPSDTLVSLSFGEFLAFATTHNSFTNVLYDTKDVEVIRGSLGCVSLEGERIVSFVEKPAEPASTITSVPIYFYPKHTLHFVKEYLGTGLNADSPGAIIPWLLEKTECFGYLIQNGYYFDVGTKEVYENLKAQ